MADSVGLRDDTVDYDGTFSFSHNASVCITSVPMHIAKEVSADFLSGTAVFVYRTRKSQAITAITLCLQSALSVN